MRVGIVGAGDIGATFAGLLVRLGHPVVLANSRGPQTLTGLVDSLGPNAAAGTVAEAASTADLVVLAIPFNRYPELEPAPFAGQIVVDTGNYDISRDGHHARLDRGEITTGELLAELLPGARVVKAFNTMWYRRLRDEGRPGSPMRDRLAIPIASDDAAAKRTVAALADQLGFAPVDGGGLADSRRQEYGTPVFNQPVGPEEAVLLLERA